MTPLLIAIPERLLSIASTEPTESASFPLAAAKTTESTSRHSPMRAPSAEGTKTNAPASTRSIIVAGSLALMIVL